MRMALSLLVGLAACGPVPTLTDTAQITAQANMARLEGTSVGNPIAAVVTSCVIANATQAEVNALAVAQSRAEMDAIGSPIVARPGYDACISAATGLSPG